MDFLCSSDLACFQRYDSFIRELLDISHPNVKPINQRTLRTLLRLGAIQSEALCPEPGTPLQSRRQGTSGASAGTLESMFPTLSVPSAPPPRVPRSLKRLIIPPPIGRQTSSFIMQLSPFDSSHRTGVPGTAEVLVPHPSVPFFPPLSRSGRRYPDTIFDVVLSTPTGRERHQYRLWYYEQRAVGTRIDEYRLRLVHDTIDLSTPGGGDLMVISRLPPGSAPLYEVTILPQSDPSFPAFLALCNREAQGKRWGIN